MQVPQSRSIPHKGRVHPLMRQSLCCTPRDRWWVEAHESSVNAGKLLEVVPGYSFCTHATSMQLQLIGRIDGVL